MTISASLRCLKGPAMLHRTLSILLGLCAVALLAVGCGPAYPNCANDDGCKSKGEFCVDGKCAQCKVDANCPNADACTACIAGACGKKANCCTSKLDCGSGKKCEANACVDECKADGDCPAGSKCTGGACVGAAAASVVEGAACKSDADCGKNGKCNAGKCSVGAGECSLNNVQFEFNEDGLTSQAQDTLSANAKCLKEKKAASLVIEGHCDERGTDAYNMELGNRRAKRVKEFLSQLMPKLKAKIVSYGKSKPVCSEESEGCFSQNRRAEFVVK